MDDLIEFLRARLDEDERAIEGTWTPPSTTPSHQLTTMQGTTVLMRPARVLREVEAKRRMLDLYERTCAENPVNRRAFDWEHVSWRNRMAAPAHAVCLFAAVYADHPDYRPEWAPSA